MNEIKVSLENVHKAFHAAGENPAIQELLINLFGKENVEQEQDITERIKTFEDACKELGEEHPLVKEWHCGENLSSDLKAYLQLRVICAALNEGWEPQFIEDEYRWFPWHCLWTESELNEKSFEWKANHYLLMTGYKYQSEYMGFTFAGPYNTPWYSRTYFGSRLCLKSEELATYCGTHFIQVWADFNQIRK